MDKQPVGQLPDLTQSNNDDEIMVITNSEYNQLKKEKISDFITDLTSTNENNALIKGADNKLFVTDFGNAANITEGTLPVSVLPDIPKDLLPASGVTAGTYITPTNLQVNSKGQITSISEGAASGISREDIDTVAARPLSDNACTQENFPDEFDYWYNQKYTTFNKGYITTIGTPTMTELGVISNCGDYDYFLTPPIDVTTADSWEMRFTYTPSGTTPTTAIGLFGSNWLNVSFTTANKITATVNYSGGSLTLTSTGTFNNDDKIFGKIRYDSTGYKLYASVNHFDYGTAATNSQTAKAASAKALKLGNVSARSYLSQGSIDMKYFEFDINGANVQNYKKTGIDIIKAPDYTVVGNPTISADGIASNFSANSCIKKDINLDIFNNDFDLIIPVGVTTPGDDTGNSLVITNNNSIIFRTFLTSTGYLLSLYDSSRDPILQGANLILTAKLTPNAINYARITRIGNTIATYGYYNNRWNRRTIQTISLSFPTAETIYIGRQHTAENNLSSYTDLNGYKLSSNGALVYQPCLYIPYTETTDGTKIVDAAYFDRVQSCREQTGQALYLTLDEQNQQYYLPQGTVSGMISQNKQKIDELDTTLTVDILQAMPVGASIAYEGTTAPEDWFAENGLEVQKSEYPKLYAVVGDKYNLETTQEGYFRLPDTNVSSRFYEGSTTPGTLKDAGLPNITSNATGFGVGNTLQWANGGATSVNYSLETERINGGGISGRPILFNASRSSSVYGKSSTVQPKSITKFFIIKHD